MLSGQIIAELIQEPIVLPKWLSIPTPSSHGAELTFSGVVRDFNCGKRVIAVSYDAFIPLAVKSFREICSEAQGQWGEAVNLTLIHRIGYVRVGEVSVLIKVSSPHRDESYKASRYVIENLKTRAPIWKKEFYEDGETEWLSGHSLCGH